jgi:hypothetical protein
VVKGLLTEKINAAGLEHFKIVNSEYFNQKLSKEFIKQLYNRFRSSLTHNSVLGSGSIMVMNNSVIKPPINGVAFFQGKDKEGKISYIISISELWELCRNAIELFMKDIDIVVPQSKQRKSFH